MPDLETLLNRWQSAGVLDAEAANRIRAHEAARARADKMSHQRLHQRTSPDGAILSSGAEPQGVAAGVRWQGITALILGAILLACGVALFVSAHWDELGPGARLALVAAVVAVFHLGGGLARQRFRALSTALHAVGTLATGAAIALVGQIFNIQEHWPAAVLLWAVAALAGWALVRDQAQQTLTLLLVPAWMASELGYAGQDRIGTEIYLGRFLFVWAILYLTFFASSRRRMVQGILFASAATASVAGVVSMLSAWASYSAEQSFLPFSVRFWAWVAIAALPLAIAAFHGHKGLIPITLAIGFSIALPWCYRTTMKMYTWGNGHTSSFTYTTPNFAAQVLVAAFAVYLCWWGVRLTSRALVNFGIVGFATVVGWFYFSDIFDELGRALGLIGLGVLFLAGGWALEKMRRRILAGISPAGESVRMAKQEAQ